jgi:glycosyltransferase 2 family protein
VRLPLGTAVAAYYRSQFLNSALPGGVVGDVHRGVRHGLDAGDLGRGLRAVAWERTAGQVVFGALALVALLALASPVQAAMTWIAPAAVVAALCGALVVRALPHRGGSRRARILRTVRGDVRDALLDPRAWPVVVTGSVVVAAGHGTIFLVAAWTTGTDASPARLWPLAMLVLLAMVVPLTVGGWGPREGMAAWAFAAAGLGADQGVAAATAYGVLGLVATLPGAVVLALDGMHRRAGSRHVEGEQHVVAGQEHRAVDQPDAVGHAVDPDRPDGLDARADDGRRQRHHDAVGSSGPQHRGEHPPPALHQQRRHPERAQQAQGVVDP